MNSISMSKVDGDLLDFLQMTRSIVLQLDFLPFLAPCVWSTSIISATNDELYRDHKYTLYYTISSSVSKTTEILMQTLFISII